MRKVGLEDCLGTEVVSGLVGARLAYDPSVGIKLMSYYHIIGHPTC